MRKKGIQGAVKSSLDSKGGINREEREQNADKRKKRSPMGIKGQISREREQNAYKG